MHSIFNIRWLLLPLLLLIGAVMAEAATSSLTVSPTSITLQVGQHGSAKVSNARGEVRATSSNQGVVTAETGDGQLKLEGKKAGTATVTVRDSVKSVKVTVKVTSVSSGSSLTVSPTSIALQVGQHGSATVSNAQGTVRASSSNLNVVTAEIGDGQLKLEGKKAGTATVTVRDSVKGVKVTVTVTSASSGTGMTVSPANLVLIPGQSGSFSIANATGSVSISAPNSNVASATLSGSTIQVQAKAVGITSMTVRDSVRSVVVQITVQAASNTGGTTTQGGFTLLAWNDLGMHCMDADYSVFSILPPFNNLRAQLVNNTSTQVVTQGVSMTYEAMADPDGSINSTSYNKSNFWDYAKSLFGADLTPDTGLAGNMTPSFVPQSMSFNSTDKMFVSDGIPITPYDDALKFNSYPLVKVVARDTTGKVLAQARVVLPVSDEMSCAACHASNTSIDAKPQAGWVNLIDPEIDYKKNVLRLHDEKQLGKPVYTSALQAKGYPSAGLLASANQGKPVLCAGCHASNALPGTGIAGISPLTEAVHSHHATVKDAKTGVLLDSIDNRSACYQCHPGSVTKCLRGVMGNAVDAQGNATMDCQACHGSMSNVGRTGRVGWLDQPNCQACHHDGKRETAAVSSTGVLKKWQDTRYASNPDTPLAGFSLFRMSKGHGGLQCEACHGATHAEYPSSHSNDNLLAQDVQGRAGTIGECTACHKTVPLTTTGGPHGMHTIGSAWVSKHGDSAEHGASACAYCHGADYRGGALSTAKAARSFSVEGRTVKYTAGQKVGCYDCHNGPGGD